MKRVLSVIVLMSIVICLAACKKEESPMEPSTLSEKVSSEISTTSSTLDVSLSTSLAEFMKESFGGAGNPEYAASWYHHIENIEVHNKGDSFYSVVALQPDSTKYSKSLNALELYFTTDDLNNFLPGMCGVAEKFGLDTTDLALLGKSFYNIANKGDPMYYYSVESLGVPIFQILSNATGQPESRIKSDVGSGAIDGHQAASVALTEMNELYSGESDQVTYKELNTIAHTIMANFKEVNISQVNFIDHSGSEIKSINNH